MSSRGKINVAGILLTLAVIAFYGVLQWQANPIPTTAAPVPVDDPDLEGMGDPPEDDPDPPGGGGSVAVQASIMFVIDGSQHMFPRIGPNYFDMAKDAIVDFMERPGFQIDGRYEIGVVQFADLAAPGYDEQAQWLPPRRITSKASWAYVKSFVRDLRRSTHHTASLLEIGIREATELLITDAATTGEKHIILLTTGEYRLPEPCPPLCYAQDGGPCDFDGQNCDTVLTNCAGGGPCNRACHIRYFANQARLLGYRVSAIQLGFDWKNNFFRGDACSEVEDPYGNPPVYCAAQDTSAHPAQPDRGGLLYEIADVAGCQASLSLPLPLPIGNYKRINPSFEFGCASGGDECEPGTAKDISDTITEWVCEWLGTDGDSDGIFDLCDNCPNDANPRQRDCDRNGVGDTCQWISLVSCGQGTSDLDCDHIPNSVDNCNGGDDCLVATWNDALNCDPTAVSAECECDCDHNLVGDACQLAQSLADLTLPDSNYNWNGIDDNPADGVPDCCVNGMCDATRSRICATCRKLSPPTEKCWRTSTRSLRVLCSRAAHGT